MIIQHAARRPSAPSFAPATAVEPALRAHVLGLPGVRDAAIRCRSDLNGRTVWVVFAVADPVPDVAAVRMGLDDPGAQISVVTVSDLPRDPEGAVDDAALAALPVVTPELAHALSDAAAAPGLRYVTRARLAWEEAPVAGPSGAGPAVIDGGPLPEETGGRVCLSDALVWSARTRGGIALRFLETPAQDAVLTYAELHHAALRIAAGLQCAGLRRGEEIALKRLKARPVTTMCMARG